MKATVKKIKGDDTLDGVVARLSSGPKTVQVGFPVGADKGIIERATYNEFGTSRIPERSFMRTAFDGSGRDRIKETSTKIAKAVIEEKRTLSQGLALLGMTGVNEVTLSIDRLMSPPNAPATIAKKKSDKPLIDTGQMRQAVTWVEGDE